MVVGEEAWKKKWKDERYEKEGNGIAFSTKVIVTEVLRDMNFITEKKKKNPRWADTQIVISLVTLLST